MQVAQALMEWSRKGANPSASEKMYANIERELLTIVWGAQKFHTDVQAQRYCPDRSQTARVNLSKTSEWGTTQTTEDAAETHQVWPWDTLGPRKREGHFRS